MIETINLESRRYIGNKFKLKGWIFSLIEKHCKGLVFADIFAGTGVISAEALKKYKHIIINDFLFSNEVIYNAFFGPGTFNQKKILKYIKKYNLIKPLTLKDNYFSKNFGNKYFSNENAKIIGYIRQDLIKNKHKLSKKEYSLLLSSLIYAVDRNANTVGHYDAYIKKPIIIKKLVLKPIQPFKINKVDIFREDTNELVKKITSDIVYIDPPYNSRQYSRFYHLLETLVKWDKQKLFGVALKPNTENSSLYCTVKAIDAFRDLIKHLKCKYIVVSYNNTYAPKSNSSRNKIKLEQIKDILDKKGITTTYKKNHKFFNSGKTNFDNHLEWLFITKVNE